MQTIKKPGPLAQFWNTKRTMQVTVWGPIHDRFGRTFYNYDFQKVSLGPERKIYSSHATFEHQEFLALFREAEEWIAQRHTKEIL